MKLVKKILKPFVRPFSVGLFLTLGFIYLAINYFSYDIDTREVHPNFLINVFHRLHQTTINWKLKTRGFRKGSSDVVIVAVDEKSLEQEGQWPWPRAKIQRLIDTLMEGGAKVIGFDVIWSEEEQNNSVVALQRLKQDLGAEGRVGQVIDQHMQRARTDRLLGAAIERHQENLVLGNFFSPPPLADFRYPQFGYQNLCIEQIYRNSPDYENWDNQEPMLSVIDQSVIGFSDELPEAMAEVLKQRFAQIAVDEQKAAAKELGASEALSSTEQVEIARRVKAAQWTYCLRWLRSPSSGSSGSAADEDWSLYQQIWPAVQEEDETLATLDFERGIEVFRERYLGMKMELVGEWAMNTASIQSKTLFSGYFNAKQDSDGTIRRSFLMVKSGQSFFPSLAFHTYMTAKKLKAQVTLKPDTSGVERGFKHIASVELMDEDGEVVGTVPVNKEGYLAINYAGPQKMFAHLSAADILNSQDKLTTIEKVYDPKRDLWLERESVHDKKEFYRDKIFLVGATAVGIFDLRVTPFEENYPGVETHANVLDNLLRGDFLRNHDNEEFVMLGFMLAMGLLFSFLIARFGAAQGFLCVALMFTVIVYIDWAYFFSRGWVVSIVFPLGLLLAIYSALTIIKYFTEERGKKQLKGTFGKYVSPAIVEELLADPSNVELGGRKQNVTVFFSDVRGFTTISETLSPTDLGDLLNEYLTPMTEIIFANKGTLDKYIGDAIMAFFGAPLYDENHPKQACKAALENIRELFKLQKVLEERGLPHIDVGIGLNTGDVSVGNMGSNIVRNYTIMGDSVNLGARLEGITKQYGVRIIISEYTYEHVKDDFLTREVDCVRVKGKKLPVHIFELMDDKGVDPEKERLAQRFGEGYALYHQKQWREAIDAFKSGLDIKKDDKCCELYIQRCQDYLETPPPEDWDGVFTMTTK